MFIVLLDPSNLIFSLKIFTVLQPDPALILIEVFLLMLCFIKNLGVAKKPYSLWLSSLNPVISTVLLLFHLKLFSINKPGIFSIFKIVEYGYVK